MHYRNLLISVGVIAVVLTLTYVVINGGTEEYSAHDSDTLSRVEQDDQGLPEVVPPAPLTSPDTAISSETNEVKDVFVPAPSVPSPKPAVVVEEKPATPAPVATPEPSPEPVTPEPSGYTLADVRAHATESSCWSIVDGSVYDLTAFIGKHPGGESKILRMCGTDGTNSFMREHGGDSKPEAMLERYYLGAYSG